MGDLGLLCQGAIVQANGGGHHAGDEGVPGVVDQRRPVVGVSLEQAADRPGLETSGTTIGPTTAAHVSILSSCTSVVQHFA
jgi:hypothetical protein